MTANTTKKIDPETGEESLVNRDFTQVYHQYWAVQRTMLREYPTALNVFTWLIEIADRRNAVLVSYPAIGNALGINERTARRAISYLVDKKLVTIGKTGNTNIYLLNDRIVWKDTADKKDKYSQFSAEVYILASEQEEQYRSQLVGHAVKKKPSTRKRQTQLDNIAGIGGSAAMLSISVCSILQAISLL
jgi:hypothetical protein